MNKSDINHRRWDYDYIEKRILDALALITIGVVLLLNTTGNLSWGIWLNFIKLWPLLIISIGVGLIFSWSRLARFIGALISFIIFLSALFIAISLNTLNLNLNIFNLVNNSTNSVTTEKEVEIDRVVLVAISDVDLDIDMSFGNVAVSEDEDIDILKTQSEYSSNLIEPKLDYVLNEDTLNITYNDAERKSFNIGNNHASHSLILGTTKVVKNMNIKVGAGNGDINLEDTIVTSLNADVGAGNLDVNLDQSTIENIEDISLKVGLGNINFKLQDEIGYEIKYKVGLGELKVDDLDVGQSFGKDGIYLSENYTDATKKVEILVEVGLGNVEFYY